MKNFIPFFIIVTFLSACGNNKADQRAADNDTTMVTETHYIWQSTLNDSSGKLEMVPAELVKNDSLQPKTVVELINKTYAETDYYNKVRLAFIKTSGDTVYVKISDATYLTQQMGSTGPTMFLSGVVYTLTGLPGINYVNFDFEEGDHAGPGTYSRESFRNE